MEELGYDSLIWNCFPAICNIQDIREVTLSIVLDALDRKFRYADGDNTSAGLLSIWQFTTAVKIILIALWRGTAGD